MGTKELFILMDSTDSWTGEVALYGAFDTLEELYKHVVEQFKVDLEVFKKYAGCGWESDEFTEALDANIDESEINKVAFIKWSRVKYYGTRM